MVIKLNDHILKDGNIMNIIYRRYRMLDDFTKASRFLTDHYSLNDCSGYLTQPFFEYAHTHPYFKHNLTHRFGVWEGNNGITAITCFEMGLGEAFLCCERGCELMLPEMLIQAEDELSIIIDGKRALGVWVTDKQKEHIKLLEDNGYTKVYEEAVTVYEYDKGFTDYSLPEGYKAFSLSEENDIRKIHRCLHKGFDHPGEPDDDIDCRLLMQSGPGFRPDLTTVIKAPDDEYACYAGMWTDKKNGFAYLEPLATVPEHRRKKLAAYALTESMKKTAKEGARYCFGGDMDFYRSMGFKKIMTRELWKKEFHI